MPHALSPEPLNKTAKLEEYKKEVASWDKFIADAAAAAAATPA